MITVGEFCSPLVDVQPLYSLSINNQSLFSGIKINFIPGIPDPRSGTPLTTRGGVLDLIWDSPSDDK